MKKILTFFIFIFVLYLLFYLPTDNKNKEELKLSEENNPTTKVTTPKIIENNSDISTEKDKAKKIIKKTPKKEPEIKINLNPEITIIREKDIYKKDKYKEPKSIEEAEEEKRKEDFEMNFGISIDKEKKTIDAIKLDLQKKF
jgi:hypothetical protein